MNDNKIEFKILLRKPKYPVIIVSADSLHSAFNIQELAESCLSSFPIDDRTYITVIDSTGSEFWYSPENIVLSPGFAFKKWTKKRIIETYNSSRNVNNNLQEYSMKSLANKRLDKIIYDICQLLTS
ncbi:MAG: hypothetical protein SVR08_18510 [Spirochaetota bacterium]|nr:hypothetical protein [Spirochaetota bacterium]